MLRWLSARADVYLACLADEPVSDESRDYLDGLCAGVSIAPVGGPRRWANAAWSLASGRTATEGLFAARGLRRTIRQWARDVRFDAVIVFCSSMGQYLDCAGLEDVPAIVDLVDVDSQKWFDYAASTIKSPLGMLKRRLFELEGRRVRSLERRLANRARAMLVVSDAEAELFRAFCPDGPIHAVGNGVDLAYFAPDEQLSGRKADGPECVFVGALDYRANVEGVCWFCQRVWPTLHSRFPAARLTLVGRRPTSAVRDLAHTPGVRIAADVPDVRPYLASANVVVVPLQVARGIQNKVLEAAAMGKAIVASPQALEGLELVPGEDVCVASRPAEWVEEVSTVLVDSERGKRLGRRAQQRVRGRYNWESRLSPLEGILARCVPTWSAAARTTVDSVVGAGLEPCLASS